MSSAARPSVTILGDATLDVRVAPSIPMRPGGDVPAAVSVGPGGQGANIAVRLARLGVRTRLVCRLGEDAAGELVRAAVTDDGVELVDLRAAATGTVVVLVDPTGERTMLSQRAPLLVDESLPTTALVADWLVVSGYVLLEADAAWPGHPDASRRVIAGCSLEPGQAAGWAQAAGTFQPHLVVLNGDEAGVLDGAIRDPAEHSSRLGATLGALVVVTEPSGATAVQADDAVRATIDPAAQPIDTTGAGDAFTAALVAQLRDVSWPPTADRLEAAMDAAAALASAVTGVAGAQGRVPGESGAA